MIVLFPEGERDRAEYVLREFEPQQRLLARWLGVEPRGRPEIHLVPDRAAAVRVVAGPVPEWAVAVTRADDRLAFRLDRIGRSPESSLDVVLAHETVHQILNHLGGPRLPRWFEEGLAVHLAGAPYLRPDYSVERTAAAGNLPRLDQLDAAFGGGEADAALAYGVGAKAVRFFLSRHGAVAVRRVLRSVGEGVPFAEALFETTGRTLGSFEREFREDVTPRLPFWLFVLVEDFQLTLLVAAALILAVGYVLVRHRRRRQLDRLYGPRP